MQTETHDDDIVAHALRILESRAREPGKPFFRPSHVADWFRLKLGHLPHEVFAVAWLDTQHRLIEYQELFRGTVDYTTVHVREVVRSALLCNASAGIFAHNHPSGTAMPSEDDAAMTAELIAGLRLVRVDLLDHLIITAKSPPYSMAQHGWLGRLA